MPVTPQFSVSQNEEFVFVEIKVPYVRISSAEVEIDGRDFSFYCKPYLLKLCLPHEVVDGEKSGCYYDIEKDNGTVTAHLLKKEKGQVFENLEFLTTLLACPARKKKGAALIEEVGPPDVLVSTVKIREGPERDTNKDLLKFEDSPLPTDCFHYGFNNAYSRVLKPLLSGGEFRDIVQLPEPDSTPAEQRRELRLRAEYASFDPERYMGDVLSSDDDVMFQNSMQYTPWWCSAPKDRCMDAPAVVEEAPTDLEVDEVSDKIATLSVSKRGPPSVVAAPSWFSDEEKGQMVHLRNKSFEMDRDEVFTALHGLVDILFAYAYDVRFTLGECSVESGWGISVVSGSLSWLDRFSTLHDALMACSRRALCYPLFRSWSMVHRVMLDVVAIFEGKTPFLLKSLLSIHDVFAHDDQRYILNKLYISDYCVWIQALPEEYLAEFVPALSLAVAAFGKDDTGFRLTLLESAYFASIKEDGASEESSEESSSSSSGDSSESEEEEEEKEEVANS